MQIKKNKILITGAEGFIGSHLCEALVKKGADVKALVLYNSFNNQGWLEEIPNSIRSNMEVIPGDVRDKEFLASLTKGVDVIFHLAALISIPYSYTAPRSYLNTNTAGTLNILEAARASGVRKVISTSTSEVYGTAIKTPIDEMHPIQAQSPYAASKISADLFLESYVRSFNLPAVILRPFNTFGPRQSERAVIPSIIRQVLDDKIKAIKIGSLETKRDFNYVLDTVEAFISLAEVNNMKTQLGGVYNAGSGRAISIERVLKKIIKLTGCSKKVIQDKKRIRPKNSEVHNLIASSKKLNKLTGWEPQFTLEGGLQETINWWKARKKDKKIRLSTNYAI